MPKPNANPLQASGSMPTASNTLGSTMPQPPSSIQPDCEHTRQPWPPQKMQVTSNSAEGSVNGKYEGRKRTSSSSFSKKRRRNSVYTPLRSAKLMSSSIHRHSTWWNIGECVASESTR